MREKEQGKETCQICGNEGCCLIEGQSYKNCPECKTKTGYCEKYDATFCAECNKWLEDACGDNKCDFCKKRPKKPIMKITK